MPERSIRHTCVRMHKREQGKSTGPKSADGKATSSQNSTKHGCRATRIVVLPGESEEDLDVIRKKWMRKYRPRTKPEIQMVERLIGRDWLVLRTERHLDEAYEDMATSGARVKEWDEALVKRFAMMQRYHGAALRALAKMRTETEVHLIDPEIRRGLKIQNGTALIKQQREAVQLEKEKLELEQRREQAAQPPAGSSTCPPNFERMAESTFSANVCSLRERKRVNSADANTSTGTAWSIAASMVQRPSPES